MPKMETENVESPRGGNGVHRQSGGEGQSVSEMEMVNIQQVAESALHSFREYARSNPETVALWCLGIGFVLGWKLRPW